MKREHCLSCKHTIITLIVYNPFFFFGIISFHSYSNLRLHNTNNVTPLFTISLIIILCDAGCYSSTSSSQILICITFRPNADACNSWSMMKSPSSIWFHPQITYVEARLRGAMLVCNLVACCHMWQHHLNSWKTTNTRKFKKEIETSILLTAKQQAYKTALCMKIQEKSGLGFLRTDMQPLWWSLKILISE